MARAITVQELASWLADEARPNPLLLDVRELSEVQRCQIPQSVHMAMQTVPVRLHELESDSIVVCVCHHGARSMQVAHFLERQGFENVINLTGGIHAWATEIDTTMAIY